MAVLIIQGQLEGLNSYTKANRSNRYAGAKMKKDMERIIGWCIKQQLQGVHFTKPILLETTWYEPNRRRDPDNVAMAKKFILDAMVTNGIIVTDGWTGVYGFADSFRISRKRPRIEAKISEIEYDDRDEAYDEDSDC